MKTYALIENGKVANMVIWDGETKWSPGPGRIAVEVLDGTAANIGDTFADGLFAEPNLTPAPEPTDAEKMAAAMAAVDAAINKVATDLRYDSAMTFALRAGYTGPFHDQGLAFAQWMDEANQAAYAYLDRINAGEVAIPTPAEAVAMMPQVPAILLP
ncbi:MAG: hypothetical protein ACRYGK_12955 [Janthinobacterium lividum]